MTGSHHWKFIGIDHTTAQVAVRGKASLTREERGDFYLRLRDFHDIQEALIVSTCNRTEVYYCHPGVAPRAVAALLMAFKGLPAREYLSSFKLSDSEDAVLEHLFRMAVGLESQILGDAEIMGQVKDAYQQSVDMGMAGPLMHRALHSLFHTHKRICQETAFKDGAASASYNTAKWLASQVPTPEECRVLVLGAGKMGGDVCKNLLKVGFQQVCVTNRTGLKASQLAEAIGIDSIEYSQINISLTHFDAVVSAIGGNTVPFDVLQVKKSRKWVLVDLGSPESLPVDFVRQCALSYADIDTVGRLQAATIQLRKDEVPAVEQILQVSLCELFQWMVNYGQMREIARLKEALESLRQSCIANHTAKFDKAQSALVEAVTQDMIDKIIKQSALQIKQQQCQRDSTEGFPALLGHLFTIGEETPVYSEVSI